MHFYVMQYIDGQPLDEIVRRLRSLAASGPVALADSDRHLRSTVVDRPGVTGDAGSLTQTFALAGDADYSRAACELGIQVAEALHHAHEYGLIHRDVKPSNLLLDGQGKVWITDFGLARFRHDSGMTITGDLVGTLRYMSPEQAAGKSALLDERTDVYSLGITLYELLTLCSAFEGSDRQEVLHRIANEDPIAPRELNPAIPVDLETVVLKAVSKLPELRYANARELADDLQRVLDGKPTMARRPTLLLRAAMWAQRRKGLVLSLAFLALVALLALTVTTLAIARANSRTNAANRQLMTANATIQETLAESENNRKIAEESLRSAEVYFRQARSVLDVFGARYADRLAAVPGAEQLRHGVLRTALGYYREFIKHASHDPNFQRDLAVTYTKVGTIAEALGKRDEAVDAYQQAIRLFEEIARLEPGESEHLADLALSYNNLGLLLSRAGNTKQAHAAYEKAIELLKRLAAQSPKNERYQADFARTLGNRGLLALGTGQPDRAAQSHQQAIQIQEALAQSRPDCPELQHALTISYNNMSRVYSEIDGAKAIGFCQKAASILEKLVSSHPDSTGYRSDLALCYNNLGSLLRSRKRRREAEGAYLAGLKIQEELVRRSPSVVSFRLALAASHNNLGRLHFDEDDFFKAGEFFDDARDVLEGLVRDYPDDVNVRSSLGGVLNNMGMLSERRQDIEGACRAYQSAIEHQQYAWGTAPGTLRFRQFLGQHYLNGARVLYQQGSREAAIDLLVRQKRLWPRDSQRLYQVATRLAVIAQSGGNLTVEDQTHCREIEDLAVGTLGEAIVAGFDQWQRVEEDPRWKKMLVRPELRALAARMKGVKAEHPPPDVSR